MWQLTLDLPVKPLHPMRNGLFHPLLPEWKTHLSGRLPASYPHEGAKGEYRFIQRLRKVRQGSAYIIYQLMQGYGDDMDVVVVGEKGIWLFEVKYWNGTVYWKDGVWEHKKTFLGRGGRQVTENRAIQQGPDLQWKRMAKELVKTLKFRNPSLLASFPELADIQGGIVFSYPGTRLRIKNAPFNWGSVEYCSKAYQSAPKLKTLNEAAVMQALETLLMRHQHLFSDIQTRSMDVCARQIIHQEQKRLGNWLQQI
jgi:hypothetical protein